MTSTLETVQKNIASAACDAGRSSGDISLIAVSKTKPLEAIRPILDAGQRTFGENKVQEAAAKWPELRQEYDSVELHLIGPLQSNKVRQAVQLFDVIETLDRPKLARAIARICGEEGKIVTCYIQVNVGRETQKAGIDPDKLEGFVALCRDELMLPVAGLMCIPPSGGNPEPYFLMLKEMAARHGFKKLSMGMSGDYQTAIACGATSVRVGTALFGAREDRY